jgi:hypothetical protein
MYDLALRPTVVNGNQYKDDYAVIWRSDFGERRVGRILRVESSGVGTAWAFHLQADIAVPPPWGNGRADSLKAAQAAFRKAFERFCDDAGDLSRAFESPP